MNVVSNPKGLELPSGVRADRGGRELGVHQPNPEQSVQGPASRVRFERDEAPNPSHMAIQRVPSSLKVSVQSNKNEGGLARVKQRFAFVYERVQDLFKGLPANFSAVRYFVQAFLDKSQIAQPPVPVSA